MIRHIPRCELYFLVDSVQEEHDHALARGARLLSEISDRNWGDRVCYFSDPDGHVIAFAERTPVINS
ncbi:MAG: VOC family protein [Bacteroidia bacterium]